MPEDVAEIDRDVAYRRAVAFGDRPEQVQREIAVGAADLPVELDRLAQGPAPPPCPPPYSATARQPMSRRQKPSGQSMASTAA